MRILFLGLLVALAASPALASSPAPIVIGAVYNLTGSMASIDTPGLKGMKLAVTRINSEGGVNGRPLRLEVRDGGSDPARCAKAVRELARLKVAAVAGLNDSDYALAAGKAAAKAGIPFVTAGATLPDLPRKAGGAFFMACFSDDAQARAMSGFILGRSKAPMLLLTDRKSAFAVALADAFATAYVQGGGTVAARADFDAASPDPLAGAAAACLRDGRCQGVYAAGVPEDAIPMISALRAAGYAGAVYSGDGFDTPLLAELGDKTAAGVFFSTHVSHSNPRPQTQAFVAAWEAAFGAGPASGFAALGFDTAGLLADALARAGSAEPAKVAQALAATRGYMGATGEISFTAPHSPPRKHVVIERFENGKRSFEAEVMP